MDAETRTEANRIVAISEKISEVIDFSQVWGQLYHYAKNVKAKDGAPDEEFVYVACKGGAGDGATMEVIFHMADKPQELWRATGTYSSWDSDEWDDDIEPVVPVLKIVTVYEPKE